MKRVSVPSAAPAVPTLESFRQAQAKFRAPGAVDELVRASGGRVAREDAQRLVDEVVAATDLDFAKMCNALQTEAPVSSTSKRARLDVGDVSGGLAAGNPWFYGGIIYAGVLAAAADWSSEVNLGGQIYETFH